MAPASVALNVYEGVPLLIGLGTAAIWSRTGGMVSTTNVALGPAAGALLPTRSLAVLTAIEMPRVPSPVIPEIVTVLVVRPLPLTVMDPVAVPILLRLMSAAPPSVTLSAPL